MGGTLLNVITVIIGSLIGISLGNRLPLRIQESVITGLGLVTFFVGVSNASSSGNIIIPLISIVIGVIIGELLRIDQFLERIGSGLQSRFGGKSETDTAENSGQMSPRQRFITGFVTSSLLFCVGPLTILGSIQDGMGLPIGFQQLAVKSVLDGFAAMAFASTFGVGVLFTVITVIVVQGGFALMGSVLGTFMTTPMISEMTATGGIILMGLALLLLDLKKPRMANFIPALLIAPLLVGFLDRIGINIYPL
ncbi:MAG: DUF554 domain-containing protein [Anaerolineae bacterium]|nr:DUF554 domain-containing protein [Anaerolineae bacterium]